MSGVFITLEGIDGSGKTTQARLITEELKRRGLEVISLREPGGTKAGEMIRQILLDEKTGEIDPVTELMLFSAARRELVINAILPALNRGAVVICDRFADSTMAYQGYARGIDKTFIENVTRAACQGVWPDITVIFDFPAEVGLERARQRLKLEHSDEGRFEMEEREFHGKVRDGFMAIADNEPKRVRIVDADGSESDVFSRILASLSDIAQLHPDNLK